MNASFVEVSSPSWALWRSFLDAGVGAIVGTLYAFLGMLVLGIVGTEALRSVYDGFDLDPVFRMGMGVVLAGGAVLAFVVPLVFVAERYALLRAVQAQALHTPDGVPPRSVRLALAMAPGEYLMRVGTITGWCVAGLAAILLLGTLFTEDLRDGPLSWGILGGLTVLAVFEGLLATAGWRSSRRTGEALAQERARWARLLPLAEQSDARRRDAAPSAESPRLLRVPSARVTGRLLLVLVFALVAALAVFIVSVLLRQQCRTCDPIYWDEPVERGIDVLSLGSGIALTVCALVGTAVWIGTVLLRRARERALARWARSGRAKRTDLAVVHPLLLEARALVRLQRGVSAVAAALMILAVAVLWAESSLAAPETLLLGAVMALLLGFALGGWDAMHRSRERQGVRDALFPGDGPDERSVARASRKGRRSVGRKRSATHRRAQP